ncbi:MAG: 2-oxo acid dehydrogenase subunit E2 [Chitinophagia bacterium]
MALVDLIMPKLGESIMEATILKWHKQVGDAVQLDETVLDIATDKVDSEVPSTAAGIIKELLFGVNDVVPIGAVVARIETGSPEPESIPSTETSLTPIISLSSTPTQTSEVPYIPAPEPAPAPAEGTGKVGMNRFYSPLVMNIAQSEGISMSELELIPGTGHEYRVTKKDILQYIADKKSGKVVAAPAEATMPVATPVPTNVPEPIELPSVTDASETNTAIFQVPGSAKDSDIPAEPTALPGAEMISIQMPAATPTNTPLPEPIPVEVAAPNTAPVFQTVPIANIPPAVLSEPLSPIPNSNGQWSDPSKVVVTGETELIEMDRMRKLIAKHMVGSVQTSPHVTSFSEADVTNMVYWRKRVKDEFEKREGTRLTFTPMFIECIVNVMKRYPLINSSVNGDQIILRKDINIGMATALPSGNLIVPVIKGADQLNIVGMSKMVNRLSDAARNSQLKPDDTTGGTFTFTNVGTFGSLMGTPIINQPQVAILAAGAIKKRAAVMETPEGDTIAVRHMMYLSLSYDHRIIDGSMGASFLSDVAKEMENWDVNKRWYQYL